ncbi:Crp/Fnr family transcriptional regulator [Listeria booriae]|uniref:Crp/Fnr family transcriptional regulator n=1 Tax=Listeria booriae TaxID=1552123 RepID=UPI00162591D4|nr:Crp/Fnr family transcriptional regulator [Listeria booriae]MBC2173876.1 Crp/Fnr family transcriptional regulator [Listeria booriae]
MEMVKIVSLEEGDILEEKGDYIILSGYLVCKAFRQLIYFTQTGDFISTEVASSYSAVHYEAKSPVHLMHISTDSEKVVEFRDTLHQKIMACSMRRLDIFLGTVEERLSALLYQAGIEMGVLQKDNSCVLPYMITQKEMAEYIGCTREYLFGIRRKLIKQGKITDSRAWTLLEWDEWKRDAILLYGETAFIN